MRRVPLPSRDSLEATKLAKLLPKDILSELYMFIARLPANPTPSRAKVRPPKKRERDAGFDDDVYETSIYSVERAPKRRGYVGDGELDICRDLIGRMLSPGFWARFARPFKEPVDPNVEGIPDYFDIITCPMDLSTIKTKMDRNEYANAKEFEADIRLMFRNCYTYWGEKEHMSMLCKDFEKAFDRK